MLDKVKNSSQKLVCQHYSCSQQVCNVWKSSKNLLANSIHEANKSVKPEDNLRHSEPKMFVYRCLLSNQLLFHCCSLLDNS